MGADTPDARPSRRKLLQRTVPVLAAGIGAGVLGTAGAAASVRPDAIPGDEQLARLVADPTSATHRALVQLLAPTATTAVRTAPNGRVDPRQAGYDVVLLLGQSNMQGCGLPFDPAIDVELDGIDQLAASGPRTGQVITASEPLCHVASVRVEGRPAVGPGFEFARQLWLAQPAGRKVLLVPAALGGTSITGNADYSWDPDNTAARTNLFHRAVDAGRRALALNPHNRLAAVLWHQGEADAVLGSSQEWYQAKLLQIIDLVREALGPAPFLIGGMVPEWLPGDPGRRGIDAAHRAIPSLRPRTAFVEGPAGAGQDEGHIHYNAAGARELGLRFYGAYEAVAAGQPA
ncbi:sialate O-acetylesterase [Arthrobacter sulfonylureivorans]|uniref:sialate O-acetylesterase n=1 Tax=Arthrobacter sulfonylureivorans TaxID=2486855 RepID=UPI0039E6FBDD